MNNEVIRAFEKYFNNATDKNLINVLSIIIADPNPFNPTTKTNFALPIDSKVTLKIYDITGREIATLVNGEFKTAGYYSLDFDGRSFASGFYIYRIQTDKETSTKKMILVK